MNFGYHFLTAAPSQSACSAASSPKGRAKGAAAPARQITIYRFQLISNRFPIKTPRNRIGSGECFSENQPLRTAMNRLSM